MTDVSRKVEVSTKLAFSHYWNSDFTHTPYMHVMFDPETKQEVSLDSIVEKMLDLTDAQEGDEFEITISKTGQRPFGDRRMFLFKAHNYRRETKAECAKRIESGRKSKKSNSKSR